MLAAPCPDPGGFRPRAVLDLGRLLRLGQPLLSALPQWLGPGQGQGSFLILQLTPAKKSKAQPLRLPAGARFSRQRSQFKWEVWRKGGYGIIRKFPSHE